MSIETLVENTFLFFRRQCFLNEEDGFLDDPFNFFDFFQGLVSSVL